MKHVILVKWNDNVLDKEPILIEAKSVFEKLLNIDGIKSVKLHKNVINRTNRFDLMIVIEMNKEVLPVYDESQPHKEWKEKFGKYVENKAIFDFEE